MIRSDATELVRRRIRVDTVEELPDLPFPATEVRAKNRFLFFVRDL
jgi:hypothetical protein